MKTTSLQLLVIVLIFSSFSLAFAQVDTVKSDNDYQGLIEDIVTGTDNENENDWTVFTDVLEDLKKNPVDINKADPDLLQTLPGLSAIQINSLISYIHDYGPIYSKYELATIDGWTKEDYEKIKDFISFGKNYPIDFQEKNTNPPGPSLSHIFNAFQIEYTQRFTQILEEQAGYQTPDTNSDGTLKSHYIGSPQRHYTKLRFKYKQNVSIGFVGEKDPGEKFEWNPDTKTYGYDYVSGHFFLKNFGKLKRLAVGDYVIQSGQGLILSNGLGFGKGNNTIGAIKRVNYGIKPYTSVNENFFFRGAAATYAFGKFNVTGFFSKRKLDASIKQNTDTLLNLNEEQLFNSFQESGYHRTLTEIENKQNVGETIFGGKVEWKNNKLRIGATHFFQNFDTHLQSGSNYYQKYYFSGKENYLSSIDFDYFLKKYNFFGEIARSKSGGMGASMGMITSLNANVDISLLFRHFDKDFHSLKGNVFAERPTALNNETGVYFGLKIKPLPKWEINTFFDQYWFPWYKYQTDFPSQGFEHLTQLIFKPKYGTQLYLRYRTDNSYSNSSIDLTNQNVEFPEKTQRNYLRFHFEHTVSKQLKLRTRVERSWYHEGTALSTGVLFYQDVTWSFTPNLRMTARYALFDSEDYDSRIYAYENDIYGMFSVPPYYGKGSRYYILLKYKLGQSIDIWLRFSQTVYANQTSISSGLDEIIGDTKSEVKLQVRYIFRKH